jgi:citrate lyase subunit beta/citryl-CoA lyase
VHRSYLYVPGDRPDRVDKAMASGSDAVIIDLEDAVAPARKEEARSEVSRLLRRLDRRSDTGPEVLVRVNNDAGLADDLRAVLGSGGTALYLPKADVPSLESLEALLEGENAEVVALIETARGLLDARAVAAHPLVRNLAIGEADLIADLAMTPSPDRRELAPMRSALVVASAAVGVESPTGPVSTDFRDLELLRADTEALLRMGFGARSAIHPTQVPVINEVFTPGEDEVARAMRLVELHDERLAGGTGSFVDDDGRMVDEAVVRAARRTLSRRH